MNFELTEAQRQAVILAIAKLSLSRPGWDFMLSEIAEVLHGTEMYGAFKSHGPEYASGPPDRADPLTQDAAPQTPAEEAAG